MKAAIASFGVSVGWAVCALIDLIQFDSCHVCLDRAGAHVGRGDRHLSRGGDLYGRSPVPSAILSPVFGCGTARDQIELDVDLGWCFRVGRSLMPETPLSPNQQTGKRSATFIS